MASSSEESLVSASGVPLRPLQSWGVDAQHSHCGHPGRQERAGCQQCWGTSELCPLRPGGLLDCRRGKEEAPQRWGAETAWWSSGVPLKAVTLPMGRRSPRPTPSDPRLLPSPGCLPCSVLRGSGTPVASPRDTYQPRVTGEDVKPRRGGATRPGPHSRPWPVGRGGTSALCLWAAGSPVSPARTGSHAAVATAQPGPGCPSQAPPVAALSRQILPPLSVCSPFSQ